MKIFVDCSLLNIGGGVQVGLSFLENLSQEGSLEAVVVATPQIDQQLTLEAKLSFKKYVVIQNKNKLKLSKMMQNLEAEYKPDLVFTVFGPSYWRSKAPNLQGFALGKMLYPEVRNTYSSKLTMYKEKLTDLIKKWLLKQNSDYFVVETDVVKQRMHQYLAIPLEQIFVVSNSYSPDFEKVILEHRDKNQKLDKEPSIFVPASFYHHKNLLVLPYVAKELLNLGLSDFKFNFTIPEHHAGWKAILELSKQLGVDSHMFTLGHVDNKKIAFEYLKSDLVLCASLVESSTAVFPESFIAQRPLAVSDRDFAKKLCEDGAVYFDPFDPKDIASKVHSIMTNAELVEVLVQRAHTVLKKNYVTPAEKWQKQKDLLMYLGCKK